MPNSWLFRGNLQKMTNTILMKKLHMQKKTLWQCTLLNMHGEMGICVDYLCSPYHSSNSHLTLNSMWGWTREIFSCEQIVFVLTFSPLLGCPSAQRSILPMQLHTQEQTASTQEVRIGPWWRLSPSHRVSPGQKRTRARQSRSKEVSVPRVERHQCWAENSKTEQKGAECSVPRAECQPGGQIASPTTVSRAWPGFKKLSMISFKNTFTSKFFITRNSSK